MAVWGSEGDCISLASLLMTSTRGGHSPACPAAPAWWCSPVSRSSSPPHHPFTGRTESRVSAKGLASGLSVLDWDGHGRTAGSGLRSKHNHLKQSTTSFLSPNSNEYLQCALCLGDTTEVSPEVTYGLSHGETDGKQVTKKILV